MKRWACAVGLAALVVGCGSEETKPAAPPPPPPRPAPRMMATQELGSIDEVAVIKAFDRLGPALMRCYSDGQQRVEFLSGDVKVFMRVGTNGHLRWAFFEQSTLGDRETETCMLAVLDRGDWPIPDGGEAEVHHGITFDPPPGVKMPAPWSDDMLKAPLKAAHPKLSACKQHGDGSYTVTAYVGPAGKAGRVLAAGAAPPNADGDADVDCLLEVVKDMKVPSPGKTPAKVSFTL